MKKEYIIGIVILSGLGYLYFKKQKQKSINKIIESKAKADADAKAKLDAEVKAKTDAKAKAEADAKAKDMKIKYEEKAKINAIDLISKLPTEAEIVEMNKNPENLQIEKVNTSLALQFAKRIKDSFGEIYLDLRNISETFPEPNYEMASNIYKKYFLNYMGQINKGILTNEEKVFAVENKIAYDERLMQKYFPLTLAKIDIRKFSNINFFKSNKNN